MDVKAVKDAENEISFKVDGKMKLIAFILVIIKVGSFWYLETNDFNF